MLLAAMLCAVQLLHGSQLDAISHISWWIWKYGQIPGPTVWDRLFRMRKKTFYRQVLKLRANEASAQGLQNAVRRGTSISV
jgi:hypothetical protein